MPKYRFAGVTLLAGLLVFSAVTTSAITLEMQVGSSGKTEDKPQSKLWHTDGAWWGILPAGDGLYFYRMVNGQFIKQTFAHAKVDAKNGARADVLWDDITGTLYVLIYKGSSSSFVTYSYNDVAQTYTRIGTATPVTYASGVETATIALDTGNTLWSAYEAGGKIYVKWSFDHTTWSPPFQISSPNLVSADDIATVIAFDGRIGVMWSNQNDGTFNFRVHNDTDPEAIWQPAEVVIAGNKASDDHIHLTVTPDQTVLAAVKSSLDESISLFSRSALDEAWSGPYKISKNATRPIVLYEQDHDEVYVFYTDLVYYPSGTTSRAIVYRKAPLSDLAQITSAPVVRVLAKSGIQINDVTSTKDNVNAATNIVIAAKGEKTTTMFYTTVDIPPAFP